MLVASIVDKRAWIVVLLLASTSCAARSNLISVSGVGATVDGSTLQVILVPADIEGRSCWADVIITPVDEPGGVRLDVQGRESHSADCATLSQLRVRLPKPLGARTVRDGASGQPASLLPVAIPEATWLPDGWVVENSGGSKDGWSQ